MDSTPSATNNKCSLCLYFVKLMMKLASRVLFSAQYLCQKNGMSKEYLLFLFSYKGFIFPIFCVYTHWTNLLEYIENVACSKAHWQMRKKYIDLKCFWFDIKYFQSTRTYTIDTSPQVFFSHLANGRFIHIHYEGRWRYLFVKMIKFSVEIVW